MKFFALLNNSPKLSTNPWLGNSGVENQNETTYQNCDGWEVERKLSGRWNGSTRELDDPTPALEDAVEGAGQEAEPAQTALKLNQQDQGLISQRLKLVGDNILGSTPYF